MNTTTLSQAEASKNSGKQFLLKGDYFQALESYYEALDSYRELDDQLQISKIPNNIGNIYSRANFQTIALKFYHDAFELRQQLRDSKGVLKYIIILVKHTTSISNQKKHKDTCF